MKTSFKFYLSILILTVFISCNRNRNQALKFLGFSLPGNIFITVDKREDWNNNPSGDGEEYILFSFKSKDSMKIINECKRNHLKNLPIDQSKLPDMAVTQLTDINNSFGYFKLEIDAKDKMSYSIAIIDLKNKEILVYRVFY